LVRDFDTFGVACCGTFTGSGRAFLLWWLSV
jgi:hypothetical protein